LLEADDHVPNTREIETRGCEEVLFFVYPSPVCGNDKLKGASADLPAKIKGKADLRLHPRIPR